MSTRAMCPDKESLVSYLYDEFDGSEPYDRQEMEQHLDECESCAAEVAAFGGVRQQLREWTSPESLPLGFRVVREPAVKPRWWSGRSVPFPLAAAAALVLGAGLGMARLDVQYDAQGFRVRTGWGHQEGVAGGSLASASAPAGSGVTVSGVTASGLTAASGAADGVAPTSAASAGPAGALAAPGAQLVSTTTVAVGGPGAAQPVAAGVAGTPWRSELQALERQLRQEFAQQRQADGVRGGAGSTVQAASLVGDPSSGGVRTADAAVIQRIQQLIDQSEVRQQQNLALRIAELSREFDVQRRSDLVRIEQGFGRLNDQRELDAQQQRQLLNAIRVSQQKPQ